MTDHPILFKAAMVRAMLDGRKTQTRRVLETQPESQGIMSFGEAWMWKPYADNGFSGVTADQIRRHGAKSGMAKFEVGDRLWVKETWADVNSGGAPAIAYRANDDLRELMDEDDFLDHAGAFNYDDERLEFGENGLQFASWANDLLDGVEGRWRSPLHMKTWISRLTLPVTDVRVQRLQDISAADCIAEGVQEAMEIVGMTSTPSGQPMEQTDWRYRVVGIHDDDEGFQHPEDAFRVLWDSINAKPKPVGGKSVTHYVSYPWDGEARTETHRGLPHHIIPNPWIAAYSFDVLKQNINQVGEAA